MKIKSVRLRNFLGFGDPGLELKSLAPREVIVGANGSGKSSLLHAIEFVGKVFKGELKVGRGYLYRSDWTRSLDVEVGVQLEPEDLQDLATLLTYGVTSEQSQVNPEWRVDQRILNRMIRATLNAPPRLFDRFLSEQSIYLRVTSVAGLGQPLRPVVELRSHWGSVFFGPSGPLSTEASELMGWSQFDLEREILIEVAGEAPELLKATPPDLEKVAGVIASVVLRWNPERLVRRLQVREQIATALRVDHLPTQGERPDLDGGDPFLIQLRTRIAERGHSGLAIGPFDVVSRAYNYSYISLGDSRSKPTKMPIQVIGTSAEYDPIVTGQGLPLTLFFLKNSLGSEWRKRYSEIQGAFEKLTGLKFDVVLNPEYESDQPTGISSREVLDPKPPPSGAGQRQVLRHFPYIVFEDSGFAYLADFAASGFLEVLLVLTTAVGPSKFVVLLDEPVLNLHPSKQRELYQFLSVEGARLGNQLLVVTHSNSFATVEDLARAIRFVRAAGATTPRRLEAGELWQHAQTVKELERNPRLLDALFARAVVLVEGGAEASALPIWFEKCPGGEKIPGSGVLFVDAGGNTHFGALTSILDTWGIPWRIIADADASPRVERFGASAVTYPFPDFSDLLRTSFRETLPQVVSEVGGSGGDKDPAVARLIASRNDPPDAIRGLWELLKSFVLQT